MQSNEEALEKSDAYQEESFKSKKMRTAPIGKLLAAMAMPAIISMLVQALYNIVDTLFISWYSEKGLEALSLVFPMQMLIIAFAIGIGVGANAQIAKFLGAKNTDCANKTARNALFLAAITFVIFVVLGLTISKPFLKMFSDDAEIINMGATYLMIVMVVSFGTFIEITASKILQATGNMKIPMISQLIGAIVNIILDPIFIFVFDMGVTGAAIATVIGQVAAMTFVLIVLFKGKHDVHITFKGFRPEKKYILGICRIGFPTMVMNAIASVTTTCMNGILVSYDNAVKVLGVYFKLQSFVFMPVFGLMQGALPIMAYNYGSGDKKRFKRCFTLSAIVSVSIMTAGLLLFQFGSPLLMSMFGASGSLKSDGAYALKVLSLAFVFAAFSITATSAMQALGCGVTALIMSLLRQIGLLLPSALLLSYLGGIKAAWFCYPIAEFIVCAVFLPYAIVIIAKKFKVKAPVVGVSANSELALSDMVASDNMVFEQVDASINNELGSTTVEQVDINQHNSDLHLNAKIANKVEQEDNKSSQNKPNSTK